MPRPGVDVTITDIVAPGAAILNTGQAFMVGSAQRGPTDRAVKVDSLKTYQATFGDRQGGSLLYDSSAAFFSEGGAELYISRVGNADAVAASGVLGTSLTAAASSPGDWGNELTVNVERPGGAAGAPVPGEPIRLRVLEAGESVELSPIFTTKDAAVAWGQSHAKTITLAPGADPELPAVATTVDLAGGDDGTAGDAGAQADAVKAALARFDVALGPGQVLAPGLTSEEVHTALLEHADTHRRVALLDLLDTDDPLELLDAVVALETLPGAKYGAAFAPWALYPVSGTGASNVIPYSGIQAGLLARSDALGNPNQAAAGANGVSRLAQGLSHPFTDEQRQALNEAGITMAKEIYGDVRTYGGRSVGGLTAPVWLWFGGARTVMAITHEANAIGENYVLAQIDGRGHLFAAFESDLRGMLLRYYAIDALYGATPQDAFLVDTGPSVNTVETIANGEVHATIRVKTSPSAEWVQIVIAKVPVERPIAA